MPKKETGNLSFLFNPRSVAIVGASADGGKPGHKLLRNLVSMGYHGKIFPVNPNLKSIDEWKCYSTVGEIEEEVELVATLVSARKAVEVAKQIETRNLSRHDVKAIVCIAGGFRELGTKEGSDLETELSSILTRSGVRLVGPNCLGVIDTSTGITTNFDVGSYKKGGACVLTQSGAFGNSFLLWASKIGLVGLDKFVSLGNMSDVDMIDVMRELENDPNAKVVAIYLEGHPRAREFLAEIKRISSTKPVVILKVGKTEVGRRSARSHTGSIAGDDLIYGGAFKQYGAIRTESVNEFYDTIRAFEKQPVPQGNRVAVLTHIGGPGTICLDALGSFQELELARISEETKEKLKKMLSPAATIAKPEGYIDVTAAHSEHLHNQVLELLFGESEVDSVIQILGPSTFLDQKLLAREIADAYRSQKGQKKTLLNVVMFAGEAEECRRALENASLPTFEFPDMVARVLRNMVLYTNQASR
jgi:acyl-CoA synthetase (NDP forming)